MSHNMEHLQLSTQCIHAGHTKDQYGAAVAPIYQTSTFVFDTAEQGGRRFGGQEEGYIYTRLGNPTLTQLETKLATIEHGEAAAVTGSGMAAIASTLLTVLNAGDHAIADDTLYGCTHSLFSHGLTKFGIEVDFIDTSIPGNIKKHMKPNTKVVYFETPANPTLKIVDLERAVAEGHSQEGVLVIVDNTFATPINCQPLTYGVDVVVHSGTKYLNGHSDVVNGAIISNAKLITEIKMLGIKDLTGAVLSPNDAFLVSRGLLTLEPRVTIASENGLKVAHFLASHPAVDVVYYPGLESHPNHEIAKKQMKNFGGMISFELKGGFEKGVKLLNNLKLCTLAVSLGGCETLIQHPASMTHACVPKEEREAAGLTDGLIRISCGIEAVDDLIADLKAGLDLLL